LGLTTLVTFDLAGSLCLPPRGNNRVAFNTLEKPLNFIIIISLTTPNAAGSNGLTWLPKHGGARDSKFLVTHPMTDQCRLTSTIARRSALTAGPFSSSELMNVLLFLFIFFLIFYRPGNESFEPYLVYKTLKCGCFTF
jgi:hypothetical protein